MIQKKTRVDGRGSLLHSAIRTVVTSTRVQFGFLPFTFLFVGIFRVFPLSLAGSCIHDQLESTNDIDWVWAEISRIGSELIGIDNRYRYIGKPTDPCIQT